jgi:uncharacterized protein (DUF433 family)
MAGLHRGAIPPWFTHEKRILGPIKSLFDHLEAGDSIQDFLEEFPSVEREQIVLLLEQAKVHALDA